jgi:hypothetical protein
MPIAHTPSLHTIKVAKMTYKLHDLKMSLSFIGLGHKIYSMEGKDLQISNSSPATLVQSASSILYWAELSDSELKIMESTAENSHSFLSRLSMINHVSNGNIRNIYEDGQKTFYIEMNDYTLYGIADGQNI